jgi:CO/xanthine dehydrogenase FAD-binding subunit
MAHPAEYYRPATLEEALRYLQPSQSIALAGGALTLRALSPPYRRLIDLQDIAELRQIETNTRAIHIGGAATLQRVAEIDGLPPALRRSLTRTITPNLRNATSVGESLIAPNPPREWLAALVALEAEVEIAAGDGQRRIEPVSAASTTAGREQLQRGIITAIIIPRLENHESLGASFVARTPADEPIVNAAVFMQRDHSGEIATARAVIGGASAETVIAITLTALRGQSPDDSAARAAAETVSAQVDPVPDYRGSVEYRRVMAGVCTRRALLACAAS